MERSCGGSCISKVGSSGLGGAGDRHRVSRAGGQRHVVFGEEQELHFGGRKAFSDAKRMSSEFSQAGCEKERLVESRQDSSGGRQSAIFDCFGRTEGRIKTGQKGQGFRERVFKSVGRRFFRRGGRHSESTGSGAEEKEKARKGYWWRRHQKRSVSTSGQTEKEWKNGRSRSDHVSNEKRTMSSRFKHQCTGEPGNAEDVEGEKKFKEPCQFGRVRRHRFEPLCFGQFQRRKVERSRTSTQRLQSGTQTHEKASREAHPEVHQGGGGRVGCGRVRTLQTVGLHPTIELGQTAFATADTLCPERNLTGAHEREDRTCSTHGGATIESPSSSIAGSGKLAGGIESCGPPREAEIWRRAGSIRENRFIPKSYGGFRKEKSERCQGRSCTSQGAGQEQRQEDQRRGCRAVDSGVRGVDKCFEEGTVENLISRGHGSFSRFMRLFGRAQSGPRAKTPSDARDAPVTLFPSMLPWDKPPGKSKNRRGSHARDRYVALGLMRNVWGFFNYLESGSPCTTQASQNVVDRALRGIWTATHEAYAITMFKKLVQYVSHPRETMERGTAALNELIANISINKYDPSKSFDLDTSGARPVDPSRISLPEVAAVIDPRDHLTGKKLEEFKTMGDWVPQEFPHCQDRKPCHKVNPAHWEVLLKKLHKAQMIEFLPVEDVLHDGHSIIKGGLFCVAHKPTSDRLINDRRPLNARERRLNWCELPAGPLLKQLILEPHESVRCSGDDLSNYFYLIKHLDSWLHRNCFGGPVRGNRLRGLGLDPTKKYLPAFRVVCMGDTNGVDIAQATHEAVLIGAGCLKPHRKLTYGKTFPASNTLEGLYIDDHLVFQVIPKKKCRDRRKAEDEFLVEASRAKYGELGLPTSEKKAINKSYSFKAWGTAVCSESGRVGSPIAKLKQIEQLTCDLVAEGWASKKAMQKLVGLFVHPFMHRRECMSVFHHTYLFIERMPERGTRRLPHFIRDELLCAALLLPFAHASIRAPVSVQLAATDASSKRGGRASTLTTKSFARTLYRHAETKGEHVRLDHVATELPIPTEMMQAPKPLVDSLQKHHWTASQSMQFDRAQHINILELEMVKQEIKSRANSGRGFPRVVNLCDSRVVVGCFGKGRSSSKNLNHKLRSCVPWLLASDLQLVNIWVPTDKNPSDYPSRDRPIPPPEPCDTDPLLSKNILKAVQCYRSIGTQALLDHEARTRGRDPIKDQCDGNNPGVAHPPNIIFSPKTFNGGEPKVIAEVQKHSDTTADESLQKQKVQSKPTPRFREIFAGKCRLTDRVGKAGVFVTLEPLEYIKKGRKLDNMDILNPKVFERLKEDAKLHDQVWHFGQPCGSFSIIQHSNGGTRRMQTPEGDGTLLREIEGNLLLARSIILIDILVAHGNFWTLENPLTSYLWSMPSLKRKLKDKECFSVTFDQCAYGLKLPDENGVLRPCKKATRIIGNISTLEELSRKCTCVHKHVHALGGVRTPCGWKRRSELAGHYPIRLCDAYAQVIEKAVVSQ